MRQILRSQVSTAQTPNYVHIECFSGKGLNMIGFDRNKSLILLLGKENSQRTG